MTQYLLSVHGNQEIYSAVSPEDTKKMYAQVDAFNVELFRSGAFVFADGLEPASTATVVKTENGKTVTTDGPYMETKEHIGGFWIIRVKDMDAALAWAAKASAACQGPVEVRPFQQMPDES
ncbi:MAG: YciI family protein [Ilumatobacteraceae bacterium]